MIISYHNDYSISDHSDNYDSQSTNNYTSNNNKNICTDDNKNNKINCKLWNLQISIIALIDIFLSGTLPIKIFRTLLTTLLYNITMQHYYTTLLHTHYYTHIITHTLLHTHYYTHYYTHIITHIIKDTHYYTHIITRIIKDTHYYKHIFFRHNEAGSWCAGGSWMSYWLAQSKYRRNVWFLYFF